MMNKKIADQRTKPKASGIIKKVNNLFDVLSESALRKFSIKYRLFFAFLIISVIPLIVITFFSSKFSYQSIENNIGNYTSALIDQVSINILNEMGKYEAVAYDIMVSREMLNYIDMMHIDDKLKKSSLLRDIDILSDKKMDGLKSIQAIIFLTSNYIKENKTDNRIINDMGDSLGIDPIWDYTDTIESDEQSYDVKGPVLYQKVINPKNSEYAGVLIIIPKQDSLTALLNDVQLGEGKAIHIINGDRYFISTDDEHIGGRVTEEILNAIQNNQDKHYSIESINSEDMLLCSGLLGKGSMKIVSLVPFHNLTGDIDKIKSMNFLIIVMCVALVLLFSLMVTRSVVLPVIRIKDIMNNLKKGDFSKRLIVSHKDEVSLLSEDFNAMMNEVGQLFETVQQAAVNVFDSCEKIGSHVSQTEESAKQVALAISEITENSSEQANESELTQELMAKLDQKINEVIKNSDEMNEFTQKAKEISENSIKVMHHLDESSKESNQITEIITKEIINLSNDIKQINQIVKIIRGVSEQSNLLSLNASIEAARAGDAGKGFTVVAQEFKKLADESAGFSDNIKDIIQTVFNKVDHISKQAEIASIRMAEQLEIVDKTEKTFKSIMVLTNDIMEKIADSNALMEEMGRYKADAVLSINSITNIIQDSASGAQEVNASTEEQLACMMQLGELVRSLILLSDSLKKSVSNFKYN